jgi:hypothetical protein
MEAVKTAAIAVCCVLLASLVWAESVEVETKPLESSSHVQITVVLGGKPLKGVTIDFYKGSAESIFSALTDENGIVTPPELKLGDYQVVAALDENVQTSLWLRVVDGHEATKFSMDLTESFARSRDDLQRIEKLPVRDHVQAFQGIVVDPSGALIPGTKIRIIKKGSLEKDAVVRIEADANGHFSAQLTDGLYIGFFYSQGFRTGIVPFEITKDGAGDLRITLQIGQTT